MSEPENKMNVLPSIARDSEASLQVTERDWVLGVVSHELRNPLSAVALMAEALARDTTNPRVSQMASRILRSARRMQTLINDLLDVSQARLTSGISVCPIPMNIHQLCSHVVAELQIVNPGREIRLETAGDGCGCWDPARIEQIVFNLISNALDHGSRDAPVTISVSDLEQEIALSIHNLGKPISPASLESIFEPFMRVAGVPSRPGHRNLGLGLFVVKQLVSAHDGWIEVTSCAIKGTRFSLRLPRIRVGTTTVPLSSLRT